MTDPSPPQGERESASVADLIEAALECADDLAAEIDTHNPEPDRYPTARRRYERDIAIVHRVRHLASALRAAPSGPTREQVAQIIEDDCDVHRRYALETADRVLALYAPVAPKEGE